MDWLAQRVPVLPARVGGKLLTSLVQWEFKTIGVFFERGAGVSNHVTFLRIFTELK